MILRKFPETLENSCLISPLHLLFSWGGHLPYSLLPPFGGQTPFDFLIVFLVRRLIFLRFPDIGNLFCFTSLRIFIMAALKVFPVSCNSWFILDADNCFSHLNMFHFLGSSCINFGLYLEHYQCCLGSEFCWFNPMNIISMLLADNFQGWVWTANYISYVADSVSVQIFWMSLDCLGSISHMQRYSFAVLSLD